MAADLPENYEGHPAFQFIRDVGVEWDTSIVLNGENGDFITIARKVRNTDKWFLGSITDENERIVEVSLNFLDDGKEYMANIYSDSDDSHWDKNTTAYKIENKLVNNSANAPLVEERRSPDDHRRATPRSRHERGGPSGSPRQHVPHRSEIEHAVCEVVCDLPAGLRGHFVRNGPNHMFEPPGKYHTFDGDGMLHGIEFLDGRVVYRNRWIRSRGLRAEIALGRAVYPGLSDVMNFPAPELVGNAGPIKNRANTHIVRHAGKLLALWEQGLPTEVTQTLDTVGEWDFAGALSGAMTAGEWVPECSPTIRPSVVMTPDVNPKLNPVFHDVLMTRQTFLRSFHPHRGKVRI